MTATDSPLTSLGLAPELELLVCCGQARESEGNEARLRALLTPNLDWAETLRRAHQHGMLALLHERLGTENSASVPAEVRDTLRRYSFIQRARNLQAAGELLRLLDAFAAAALPVMAFKGPVLAVQAYGSLTLRAFADLDLLVRPEDAGRACAVIEQQGYVPRYQLTAGQQASLLRFGCEHPYQRAGNGGQQVDLHWNLFPPSFPISFRAPSLWRQAETMMLGQREITTIRVEQLVVYLCAHGYAHHWNRLEWICALGRLIAARPQLDWAAVQKEAGALGAERVLELGLLLAGDWMNAPIPAELIETARSRRSTATQLHHVRARLQLSPEEAGSRNSTLSEELFFDLDARENHTRRISYFLRRLLMPSLEDVEWISLPPSLSALHYALRPLRLAARSLSPKGRNGAKPLLESAVPRRLE